MERHGDAELEAPVDDDVQGVPLLSHPTASAGRTRAGLVAAALLAGVGLSALALGRLSASEERGTSPAALPAAGLQARLQLSEELTPPSTSSVEGFHNTTQAFEAIINKTVANWNVSNQIAYEKFKQLVNSDEEESQTDGGSITSAMQAAIQKASSGTTAQVKHTKMEVGVAAPPKVGRVAELYTFGAPGTAIDPLYDATQPNGCIQGLRSYTKGIRFSVGAGTMFRVTDPVAWICNLVGLQHGYMDSLEAMQSNDINNKITQCGAGSMDPSPDGFFWITGHLVYPKILNWHKEAIASSVSNGVAPNDLKLSLRRRLQAADQAQQKAQQKVETAALMAHFAFMNYHETPMITVDAPDWGWHLVGRACAASNVGPFPGVLGLRLKGTSTMQHTTMTFVDACKDHTLLYQKNTTLECALVFEGSDDLLDWLANLDFVTTPFCGLGWVHAGFRAKVLRMVGGVDYAQVIRPNLKHCSKVTVAGHSLGGAQAEIFTACANRMLDRHHTIGYNEYRAVTFDKGVPKKMMPFHVDHAQGVFIRNKANGMCMDVKGTTATDYGTSLILFWCEFPNAGFSQDQKWDLKSNGLVVNQRSDKCMATAFSGSILVQVNCDASDTNQQWELTPEHFLKNKGSGLCVDGSLSMITCPYTDQRWTMPETGKIVNQLSGLCLNVIDSSPHSEGKGVGDDIVLGSCDGDVVDTWDMNGDGALVNRVTGLCLNLKPEQGREDRPTMVLGECNMQLGSMTMLWELSNGFFKNKRNGKCLNPRGMPAITQGSLIDINACEEKSVNVAGLWQTLPTGFIRNIGNDHGQQYKCITVDGEPWDTMKQTANGTTLSLVPCKIATDQKWEITSNGFIKNVIGGQKCVDLVPTNVRPGGTLWLMNCANWDDPDLYLSMKFNLRSGALRDRYNFKCIGTDPTFLQGQTHLINCTEARSGKSEGNWSVRPDGAIEHRGSCLDVGQPDLLGAPRPVVLRPCIQGSLKGTTQEWDFMANGFVWNRYHSLCMNPQRMPGRPSVHNALLLVPCPVTTQVWQFLPSGQIKNRITGKCIDVLRNVTGTSWWDLTEWTCEDERKEQVWEKVA